MSENWKDVINFKGIYQVSNKGRVRSLDRTVQTSTGHKRNLKGRLIATSKNSCGYMIVNLRNKEKGKRGVPVHRLVALAFIPNPKNKPCINHIDAVRTNNNVENLEWCTHKENVIHGVKIGNFGKAKGVKHGLCKLTDEKVREIRELNLPSRQIARIYGVGQTAILNIKRRETWNHVT